MLVMMLILVLTLAGSAVALPPIAAEFYGTMLIHGTDAPKGMNITAYDPSGVKCGAYATTRSGYFGLLSCNGDDIDTTVDEGAISGNAIQFKANGSTAYALSGNTAWESGNFSFLSLLALKNNSPYFYGCSNATIEEDGDGSGILIDMWSCAYDQNDNISALNFSLAVQTNQSLISCYISGNRYITCNNPAANATGRSYVAAKATNHFPLSWTTNLSLTVTPVNDPPFFLTNLTTQYAYDSQEFTYRINCSDVDNSAVYYYDNSSMFTIDSTTGIINFTPSQAQVGNHSILITCSDDVLYKDGSFTLAVININNPPVLNPIGNLQARSGFSFTRKITASDPDSDNLTFYTNSTLFQISQLTGVINFTPTASQVGNYTINVSVSDGSLADFEVINFTVRVGAFCGDSLCTTGETCSNCQTDCGQCPTGAGGGGAEQDTVEGATTGAESGTAAAGVARAARAANAQAYRCIENWKCGDWLECSGGVQRRLCRDVNKCGTSQTKLDDKRSCVQEKLAEAPSCFDGVKNQDEKDTDCGGPCKPCSQRIFATLPIPKINLHIDQLKRQFPVALIIAVLAISASVVAGDQAHLRKIRKLPLEKYKEKASKYRPKRRMLYRTTLNLLMITLITSLYIYWFSNCNGCMKRYLLPLAIALVAVPFAVAFAINKIEFSEYKSSVAERRLKHTHEQQINSLLSMETKLAMGIEDELVLLIKEYGSKAPQNQFSQFLEGIREVSGFHSEKLAYPEVDGKLVKAIESAIGSKHMLALAKDSLEIRQLKDDAKELLETFRKGESNLETEKNFLEGMEEVATSKRVIAAIAEDQDMASIYNSLVDVYSYIIGRHKKSELELKNELNAEAQLLKGFLALFEDKEQAESHAQDRQWVRIYNLLVDLNDHYQKKQEQSEA